MKVAFPVKERCLIFKDGWREIGVLLVITMVILVFTFPLVLHLTDQIPGSPGDNLYFFWEIWWFKRALFELQVSPFVNHEVYYPVGLELARDEMTPANTILGLPFTLLAGPVVSYNLLALSSFILSGYAAYQLIFQLTRNRLIALIGGIAFSIIPYRMMRFFGHLNLLTTQWLVFTLIFTDRLLLFRRVRDGVLAGIFLGLNALAAWYYLYISLVILTIFTTIRTYPWRESLSDRRLWRAGTFFFFIATFIILPFALPYIQLNQNGTLQRSFSEFDGWSANITDFVQPNPLHPLWGKAVRQIFPFQWSAGIERNLMTGSLFLVLAVIGGWVHRRKRSVQVWLVLALASFIIALGPTLHWNNQRIVFPLPSAVTEFANQSGLTMLLASRFDQSLSNLVETGYGFIPLPAMIMYAVVPYTSSLRAILRFGVVTDLAVIVLAAFGILAIVHAVSTRIPRYIAILIIASLATFEIWSVIPNEISSWTPAKPRPVDAWLSTQTSQSLIIEFPLRQNIHPIAMLYQTFNRQLMIYGGMQPSFQTSLVKGRLDPVRGFPSQDALNTLRVWGTRYVLVSPFVFTPQDDWSRFESGLNSLNRLEFVQEVGGVLIYEIR
ncbi:MAG: hypothetical protein HZB51_23330 [Chloroflexi bacterium]|nr:hypothetical protein [Chloroflexota bacterium]